ncbi:MBL fold metallo-hydrolase [Promethearchaeum syntrophicum]|uniref:MBL fold metallo-hydrolase n=1 Tax=Promethearchaeum syntrophicum TaxID=2594042 RepID=A0A5B9DEB6_9ARCH|nr:MBL fold metallo-hydrolase [Candidatus Prometheoarchaeum syntrophicum]QEE17365.1 metal-dependent hydrolase [Candidatus Prometheoarchaeum syntrophicum]
MNLTKKGKIIISLGVLVVILGAGIPIIVSSVAQDSAVKLTLLDNAGVMIEFQETRIYIDPYNFGNEYEDKPADAILITHEHGDHYDPDVMESLQKEGTINVFPAIMEAEIARFDGMGVVPEESFMVGSINISTFYMYTSNSHPQSSNYTSYIIDINGFTIFHAGDSYNLVEYYELRDKIDVAMLPVGPGCQTMAEQDIITVLSVIRPTYYIPIHFAEDADETFLDTYRDSLSDYKVVHLSYFSSRRFWI